jgi:integrase
MLNNLTARHAEPRERPYKLGDRKGLYLQVEPNGSKYWRLKYCFYRKQKTLALGVYPEVTLAKARERQRAARRLLVDGIDPSEHKRQTRRAAILASGNTFEVIAHEWFLKFSERWVENYRHNVLSRLQKDVFPFLGSRPIASIEAVELIGTIRRIEARGALATAHRCLRSCGSIFRYAIATGRATRNPASDLRGALPPARTKHFASITNPEEVAELLQAIEGYQGTLVTRCALRLAPLTFVRPGELRQAEWSEFDLSAALWRIPAARMKMRKELIVPLSEQAMGILRELQAVTGRRQHLFPNVRRPTRAMSDGAVNSALRRLGYTADLMTAHGFRALARTILDEVLSVRVEWIEHQLAHQVRDANGRAYNRTAFLDGRRQMMQLWADYLDGLRSGVHLERSSQPQSGARALNCIAESAVAVQRGPATHCEMSPLVIRESRIPATTSASPAEAPSEGTHSPSAGPTVSSPVSMEWGNSHLL